MGAKTERLTVRGVGTIEIGNRTQHESQRYSSSQSIVNRQSSIVNRQSFLLCVHHRYECTQSTEMDFFASTKNNNNDERDGDGGGDLSEHLLTARGHDPNDVAATNDYDDAEAAQRALMMAAPVDPATASAVETGQTQPPRWRDLWAALLFLTKQASILYMAVQWGYPHWRVTVVADGEYETRRYGAVWHLIVIVTALSIGTGVVVLMTLTRIAKHNYLIPAALLTTCALQLVLTLWFSLSRQRSVTGAVLAGGMAIITVLYTRAVWHRTKLAADQLHIGLIALQTNGGIIFVAIATTILYAVWFCVWMMAALGVMTRHLTTTADGTDSNGSNGNGNGGSNIDNLHVNIGTFLLLLLSLFWTTEVCKNIVHVATAGTVGTWWFSPDDAATFWSPAVRDSWSRTITYSFGSVCLGSLWTAAFHLLHAMARMARRRDGTRNGVGRGRGTGPSMLLCVLECLLRCTERLFTYFNKWYVDPTMKCPKARRGKVGNGVTTSFLFACLPIASLARCCTFTSHHHSHVYIDIRCSQNVILFSSPGHLCTLVCMDTIT